jgi:hypothetical protein
VTQPLILNDSTLIDGAQLIVSGVGNLHTCSTNLDLAVWELIHIEILARIASILRCIGKQIELALVM